MARYLKRGMDAGAIEEADAKVRATVEDILDDIEDARRCRGARTVGEVRQLGAGEFPPHAAEIEDAIAQVSQARPRRHQVRPGAGAQLRAEAARQHAGHRGRDAARRHARPQEHPGECGRLLCAGREVSDGGLRAHVDRHRQGRGREAHHRLRAAVQGRAASGDRRRDASRRRRRDLRARRRAGGRRHGARHRDDRAGRHAGRPRQRLSWPRPSASSTAASASICSPVRPRRWSSPTRPSMPKSAPPICSARPSTARPRRPSC